MGRISTNFIQCFLVEYVIRKINAIKKQCFVRGWSLHMFSHGQEHHERQGVLCGVELLSKMLKTPTHCCYTPPSTGKHFWIGDTALGCMLASVGISTKRTYARAARNADLERAATSRSIRDPTSNIMHHRGASIIMHHSSSFFHFATMMLMATTVMVFAMTSFGHGWNASLRHVGL